MGWAAAGRAVERFRDLPLSIKGLVVIAIPVAGLLAVVIAFYFVQRANQDAERWVNQTLEVRAQIQMVHTRLEEAETGLLGYLLTRNPAWLAPYRDAHRELPRVLARLESMVRDNPAQLGRVQMLKALVTRTLESARSMPSRVPAGVGVHPALTESKDALESIRRVLDETRVEQDRLLEERRAHAQTVWARGYAVIAAGALFIPVGAIAAMLLFTTAVARRTQVLEENSRRLAQGLPVRTMRTGADEIGRLEQSLGEAAALLAARERELRQSRDDLEVRVDARTSELADANRALESEVAERKRTEDEVADANRRLRAVIDASPLAILRVDLDGTVAGWNRAAEQIFGWHEDEVLGRPLPPIPDDDRSNFQTLLERTAGGEALTAFETRRLRRDGTPVDLRVWTAPVRRATGEMRGIIAIVADSTKQRQLEQQLTQAQKMEAIGRLAGGVAHDFNNVITVVSGYGHMLLDGVKDNPELHEAAEEVLKASERATSLASQLLAFSRKQMIQPKTLDLNALVRDIHRMLTRIIGEDIELKTMLRPDLATVKADAGQLEQVLVNLVVNARDAMPDGGKLTIETANVFLDEDYGRTHAGVTPGPHVMLAVTDTGTGMAPETKAQIFEPFFTTKERGKGTGLGLSTVYGIVKQHGGDIWVYSEPGRGSTFKIYLPSASAAAGVTAAGGVAEAALAGTETVLVVEDEAGVRKLVRGVLESHGYSVLEAESGESALDIAGAHEGAIDLLVTDVVMPKMSGRGLAEALALLRPEMRVLYLSGYTDHVVVDHGVLESGVPFLQKPFTPDALARKIRDVLDRSQAA